jgi:hypothetical protein
MLRTRLFTSGGTAAFEDYFISRMTADEPVRTCIKPYMHMHVVGPGIPAQ